MDASDFIANPPLESLEVMQWEPVCRFLVARPDGLRMIQRGVVCALYDDKNEVYRVTVSDLDSEGSWSWSTTDTVHFRKMWEWYGGFEVDEAFELLLRTHEGRPWGSAS